MQYNSWGLCSIIHGGDEIEFTQVIQAIVTQELARHIYRCVNKMDKHILLNLTFFQNVMKVNIYVLFLNKFYRIKTLSERNIIRSTQHEII